MGATISSSSQHDSSETQYKRAGIVQKKTKALSNFSKYITQENLTKYTREELNEFLKLRRQERENIDDDLDKEETSIDRFRIRPKTAGVRRLTMESKDSDWRKVRIKVESDAACYLCEDVINFLINGYPCRVCTRIFHKECLEKFDGCRAGDLAMADRAHCLTGWSCYRCGDLTNLLTDDELRIMIDEFDLLDLDKDAVISREEYLDYKAVLNQKEGVSLPEAEVKRLKMMFQVIDSDGSGFIDWWEFVNHECTRILAKRNQEDLVGLLTDKETQKLKSEFEAMDDNEDGVITEFEAKKACRGWFTKHGCGDSSSSAVLGDSVELSAYLSEASRVFHNADADDSGFVT